MAGRPRPNSERLLRLGGQILPWTLLALHAGLLLNSIRLHSVCTDEAAHIPKSRLTGKMKEPDLKAGSNAPLMDHGEQIGAIVRTKTKVKPVFVSPGHLLDLTSSVRVVLETTRGYRIPEPTRLAHLRVNELRRQASC